MTVFRNGSGMKFFNIISILIGEMKQTQVTQKLDTLCGQL
jgi:hypothetical protein